MSAPDDEGSASIEFVYLSVLLILPIVYLLLTVFDVQRGAFGAGQAAREAGRAFALSGSVDAGLRRAQVAADLALANQGIDDTAAVSFSAAGSSCSRKPRPVRPTLRHGDVYVVCVRHKVRLPYADKGFFAHATASSVTVTGQYTLVVDDFRADR